MSDEYTLPVNDDIYITGEIEEVAPVFSEIDDDDSTQETVTRTPADISSDNRSSIGSGELTPSPSDVVPADVSTSDVVVTQRVRHQIDDYEPAALKALSDAGAVFYAVYADGHEDGPVSWTEVYDLDPEGTIIELDEEIASAIAQNFWADTQGVHITDDPYDEWIEAYESNPQFPNLSTTKNYYNILLNAGGALLRRALNNLVSINRTAISFYDGLGNASTNIMAFFGRNGAQIGRSDEKHVVINSSGIGSYNGDGTVADFTMRGSSIVNGTISGSSLVNNTITGGKIANATITGSNIDSGTITNANIANGTITGAKIDSGTITNANIADGTITGTKIQGSTLTDIPFAAITDADIEVASIADAQIATATITEAQVANLTTNYAHLQNGVIDNATIDHADVNGLNTTYATISNLNSATARIGDLEADHVSVDDFEAEQGYIDDLQAATADIATIRADSAKVHNLTAAQLSAATAYIASLTADSITASSLSADVAKIHNLTANEISAAAAYIAALNADSVTAQNIIAMNGDFATVKANAAKVANLTAAQLEADHATVGSLDANYAQINMANVNNAWIANGTIKDGAISNGMINSVSANKLTAGTIDASNITVTNLNADNITTGTINGQRIGEGSLSLSKLEEDVYTETEVDGLISNLQTQIDGAIETWTGTDVPTLSNSPASSWTTNAIKDTHVGDVYFVVNSQSQQNGYNYRFTKSGNTYSWQLIKDSDVTSALSRLSTAEGKIGNIEQFDTTVSSFMTDTDEEISSIKTAATTLAGRVTTAEGQIATKVDTTTFNTLSQTVGENSAAITQLTTETTTISSKVDSQNPFIVGTQTAQTGDWTGNAPTLASLVDGQQITYWLPYAPSGNASLNLTLKNGNTTGAIPCYYGGTSRLTTHYSANNAIHLTYRTNISGIAQGWWADANYDSNSPYSKYSDTVISGKNGLKRYTLCMRDDAGNFTSIVNQANNTNVSGKTCYTGGLQLGSVCYHATGGDYAAGANSGAIWESCGGVDFRYSVNGVANAASTELQLRKPVYLVGTIGADGLFYLDTTKWWTQTSFVENKAYVFVGTAYSNYYAIFVAVDNPTYIYEDGELVEIRTSQITKTTNKVNTVSDTVDEHTRKIGALETTVETKADGSEVTTVSNRLNTVSETVDGHTSQLSSITSTQTTIQGSAVKSTVQLWFTKANTTAPNKPTAHVTTNNAATGNAWNLAVPTYNASYPNYYYCYEYEYLNGTYGWSAVTRDIATGEMQATARQAQNDIDNLEIGGRNLLYKRVFAGGRVALNGDYSIILNASENLDTYFYLYTRTQLVEGITYVISCEASGINGEGVFYNFPLFRQGSTINGLTINRNGINSFSFVMNATELGYHTATTINDLTFYRITMDDAGRNIEGQTGPITLTNFKLEKGNKATDWTPAPEDINADISTAQTSADNAQATANKNIKESQQLWFTKANGSAPAKPTAKVTSTSTSGNAWTTTVPTYSASYPYYFYCMQYIAADGTVTWSDVVYDQATTEAQSVARTTSANLSTLQSDYATFKQTTQNFESTVGSTYATKTELNTTNGNVTALQNRNDTLDAQYGYPYKKDIVVYGESNKYYPVYFTNTGSTKYDQYVTHDVMIKRGYAEQGPSDWNTSTHRGSLNLHFGWNYGGWGGATYKCDIYEFSEMYSTLLGDILVGADSGMFSIVYLRGGGTTGAIYHVYSDVPFIRHAYMVNAGVVGENDVPYVGLEQNLVYASSGDTYQWKVRAPLTEPNIAHLTSLKTNTSMRFTLVRSTLNETQWASYSTIGHTDSWSPNSPTATSSTYAIADCRTLNVGDTFVLTGVSTDKSITHSIVCEVTAVPTAEHGNIPAKTIAVNDNSTYVKAVESRVTTAETSIQQNRDSIALKANASDVYTKTQTDGLISTEVTNRNSAIEQSANAINLSVGQTYATKTELASSLDSRVSDTVRFVRRKVSDTAGVKDGVASARALKGNTIVMNQLREPTDGASTQTMNGITWTRNSDGSIDVSGTATASGTFNVKAFPAYTTVANHKYLVKGVCPSGGGTNYNARFAGNTFYDDGIITKVVDYDEYNYVAFRYNSGAVIPQTKLWPQIFDLTHMFGAGCEPTTVAEFEKIFPDEYYPYEVGSAYSVDMHGVESTGFNRINMLAPYGAGAYNQSAGYQIVAGDPTAVVTGENPCEITLSSASNSATFVSDILTPSYKYYIQYVLAGFQCKSTVYALDSNHKVTRVISTANTSGSLPYEKIIDVTLASNERYIAIQVSASNNVVTATLSDTCINLYDTSLNGQYKPYMQASGFSISTSLMSELFPNGMNNVGAVCDELTPEAAITRVGVIDLGTLSWSWEDEEFEDDDVEYFYSGPIAGRNYTNGLIRCEKYRTVEHSLLSECDMVLAKYNNSSRIAIRDDATDATVHSASDIKAAMSGVILYYELETPVVTPINPPLNFTYRVDSDGIERLLVDESKPYPQSAPITMDVDYGADLFGNVADTVLGMQTIDSRVSTAETSIQQNRDSIALKANASDVYTKTQTDGLISTEASNRNSAIEQSANAINLSVSQTYTTKTEFNALEVGGRNLLRNTNWTTESIAEFVTSNSTINQLGGALGTWGRESPAVVSIDSDGLASFTITGSTRYGIFQDVVLDPGTYTLSALTGANFHADVSSRQWPSANGLNQLPNGRNAITFDVATKATYRVYINCSNGNTISGNYLKLERGNKATDWTPAPEDMVTTTAFESAKSEIQQTTDGITSTVEKISSAKYLTSAYNGWSLTNIKAYGSHDTQTTFTVVSTDGVRVGDTVYIKGTDTTRSCTVYIKGVVKTVSSATSVTVYGRGYEDVLPVETIKSTINQSADSVKIEARHVNIEGAAIFSSGRLSETSLNNAYDLKGSAEEAYEKIQSRGIQLVTNGNGFTGDNTNFSSWIFDGSKSNGSPGSFTRQVATYGVFTTDERFPVDTSKTYEVAFDIMSEEPGAKAMAMLTFYDIDKNGISVQMVSYYDGSTTTLANDLKNGDTKVYLTSAAGFQNTTASYQRSLIFWNYTNSFGYTYPPETYSRNFYENLWASDSSVDKTNNTITLSAAWNKGTIPAGTSVSQNLSGNNYSYFWSITNKNDFPREWMRVSGTYVGVRTSGDPNQTGKFWPGTAYCKVGWLWNYAASSSDTQGRIWITNVSVKEDTATASDVEAVQANLDASRTWYAESTTAAATAAKDATITPASSSFALRTGMIVNVKFSTTNSAAVESLTLNVNGTGAKPIKYLYNNSLANVPAAGYLTNLSIYQFVYDGTNWAIQNMNYNTDNNSIAMNVKFYNTIVAGQALAAASIIGGRTDGKFYQIKENSSFDLSHPLLWLDTSLNANATNYANIYTQCYDRNLGTYYTSFTNTTANRVIYLVGTISGNTFSTYGNNSSQYLTITTPTAEDGRFYIPIGRLGNQSNGKNYFNFQVSYPVALFAFLDGKFRQVTPTEIVASHRIYYRTGTANNSLAAPTTWVAEATADTYNAWTTKIPPLSSGVSSTTKYPYLYTCEQRKRLDGTVECTKVLLDDSNTIIDGGTIITGSVYANALNASSINASNMLTVGSFSSDTQSSVLNSEIEIGGRNLFAMAGSIEGYLGTNGIDISSQSASKERTTDYISVDANTKYSLQTWYDQSNPTSSYMWICLSWYTSDKTHISQPIREHMTADNYKSWVLTSPTNAAYARVSARWVEAGWVYGKVKFERGNCATDWTPAPEDQNTPIASRTYTGLIGTSANNAAECSFYFAKVHPTVYAKPWSVTLHIEVTTPYIQMIDIEIRGDSSNFRSYNAMVSRDGSYLSIYYINLYRATQAGITAGKGHALGLGLRASTNCSNSSYARTTRIDVVSTENCTVSMMDTAVKYANMDGTGSTNYTGLTELGVTSNGQNATNNGNTYDRTYHNNPIKAATAITAGHVICGTSAGYKNIAAGTTFDIAYPLLYSPNAIAINNTRIDAYSLIPSVNFSNNGTIQSGVTYAQLYLKGTIVGNTFEIAASPFMTTVVPTTEDGYFYIPMGIMSSTTSGYFESSTAIYAFLDGKFRQVTPTEIVASHRIYYRTGTVNNSLAAPTTWVAEATGDVYNAWTTKVPKLTDTNDAKYAYLYTCEQRKRLDGTVECTSVQLDDSTTIIDGGTIITGSIAANKLDVYDATIQKIRANAIDTASINIGQSQVTNLSTDIANAKKHTQVLVSATNVNYAANTCTLTARLYIDGVLQTSSSLKWQWYRDGTVQGSQQTASTGTLSVTSALGLGHRYACKCTF